MKCHNHCQGDPATGAVQGTPYLTPPHYSLSQSAGFHYHKKPTQLRLLHSCTAKIDRTSFSFKAKLF